MHNSKKIDQQHCGEDNTITYPQGIKWTRQRKDVYEVLYRASEPMSAVQIYQQIAQNDPADNYAVSTIYRILAVFEEKSLIVKMNWIGQGTTVYELNRGGHKHYAVCLHCNKRIPLQTCPFEHDSEYEGEKEHGLEASGFHVIGHKLELYGYCENCENARTQDEIISNEKNEKK